MENEFPFIPEKRSPTLRASVVELQTIDTSLLQYNDDKIHLRDYDNLYPLRIEKVINNSPTAKRCANLMSKYIAGNGVKDDFIVNKKSETLNDIIHQASLDLAYHYGVYFHVKYKLREAGNGRSIFEVGNIEVIDYIPVAVSKKDDGSQFGKFYILQYQEYLRGFDMTNEHTQWLYPYNPDRIVIETQMKNDCKLAGIENPSVEDLIKNYRGQVFYLNMTPKSPYALPLSDVVYDDMDTEYRMSKYINNQVRGGWMGKTIIVRRDDMENEDGKMGEVLNKSMGANGSADLIDLAVKDVDDIDKVIKIIQVNSQYDDKMFEKTEKKLRQNIMGSFNNPPEILIMSGSGALFGPNSETYIEAKKFYWEQNEMERKKLESVLSMLLEREISFIPINGVENKEINKQEENELPKS